MSRQLPYPATAYVGRFAPSPTGPLHLGSLVAALASRLDALANRGVWLLRIEDVDRTREVAGAREKIVGQLDSLGFRAHGEVIIQSQRSERYQRAFDALSAAGLVYGCACSRREIAEALRATSLARPEEHDDPAGAGAELPYPGTCRAGLRSSQRPRAWRLRVGDAQIDWEDRNGSAHRDALAQQSGDFVIRRADGMWAYQLAVVVDDGDQQVTDVVRGEDLRDSTARQIFLQQRLGLPRPRYLHVPLVLAPDGRKLSKHNGAPALDSAQPIAVLNSAMVCLGLPTVTAASLESFWSEATAVWARSRWCFSGAAANSTPSTQPAHAGPRT